MEQDEVAYMLGEIRGDLKNLNNQVGLQGKKLHSIDKRLRSAEISAAGTGAIVGAVVAIGTSLIAATFKSKGI
ncbi:MAG: hypothetical protein ACN4GR_07035 [Arenicellales bacterium]